ncbi:hypothetical protein F5878DRAFT_633976 [Lentinula raphanica]|uniref:F-box domain-containing protein n=1 Tax=Lentinula raphanica TaxID=153919 RepID=A0AA38NYN3_9AGAR|nr:hypothetical protein F5878DRAFT_633976 [Lentinula raphanica]
MEDSQNHDSPKLSIDDVSITRCERSDLPLTTATHRNLERSQDTVVDSNFARPRPSSHSAVVPIRLLSTEILQLIFLFAVSHQWREFATHLKLRIPSHQGQSWAGVLSLTWVCSWWRKVALSYPTIWRSIHINFGSLPLDDSITHSGFVDFVGECLRRSGPCLPLDIGLKLMFDWNDWASTEWHHHVNLAAVFDLLNCVSTYTGRWRHFQIISNDPESFTQFTNILTTKMAAGLISDPTTSTPFPLLEEINFVDMFQDSLPFSGSAPSFRGLFTHCHSLRSLRASSFQLIDALDLRNLVFLQVPFYAGHTFGPLLKQCPHLKYLGMGHFQSLPPSAPPSPTSSITSIVHTHLRTLCLSKIGERFPTGVWTDVSFPNLTKLALAFAIRVDEDEEGNIAPSHYFESYNALTELKDTCIRSGCALREIGICSETCPSAEIPRSMYDILFAFPCTKDAGYYVNAQLTDIESENYLELVSSTL